MKELSRIYYSRLRAQLTQIELSQILGCSQAAVSYIETGEMKPSKQMKRKIAAALNIDEGVLFSENRNGND